MAYDFTGVKAITIPEGNVKKITDSAGNVLWQKVIVIENEPSQKGTLTYTGSELSPEWYYYDETMMTCTGGNVRTNAGTYMAVFKPNDGYCWSDGSVEPKTIRWTIKKAAGSLSISPTSITLNSSNTSKTITVTRAGDGAITATSDYSGISVSVSGNTITVTSEDSASVTATITVSVAAGTNHTAPASKTCSVSAEFRCTITVLNEPYVYDEDQNGFEKYYASVKNQYDSGDWLIVDVLHTGTYSVLPGTSIRVGLRIGSMGNAMIVGDIHEEMLSGSKGAYKYIDILVEQNLYIYHKGTTLAGSPSIIVMSKEYYEENGPFST